MPSVLISLTEIRAGWYIDNALPFQKVTTLQQPEKTCQYIVHTLSKYLTNRAIFGRLIIIKLLIINILCIWHENRS